MRENDWQNVKKIFLAALETPAPERARFFAENGGGNAEIIEEVESLLAAHESDTGFIETPAVALASILSDAVAVAGKAFGNYKIIREIGAGGMGAVFLAERSDGAFEQKVAIKIIRQAIAERELINRFKRERQILASLNHPNIAKLLDGGVSADGQPFLAMEYVAGETITKFAQQENLNLEDRLKLFLKVCAAVAYAHRNLTVHRDIKPSNILVTKDSEPKLLDFGLAKLLDANLLNDTEQTQTAFRALTPAYASPEQLKNEPITTASDIYSLGIIFYELLTGERPFHFEGKSLDEIIETASQIEPPVPSSVQRPKSKVRSLRLSADLDNITLMALRKEPERRYKSVEAFADDIERYLKGLPVAARPNTFKYRAGKFFKRNWAVSSFAALLLLSLIGGLAAFAWQAKVAAAQRDRAEKRFDDVRKLSSSLLFEISPQIERLPGSTLARQTIVRRALEYLDSLAAEAADDESLQSELATAYEQVGDVQGKPGKANLGDLKGATESYLKAQKIRLALAEKDAGNLELQRLLAANYFSIGELEWWSSKVEGALENYRAALGIYENLAAREPENLEVNRAVIRTNLGIAAVLSFNSERKKSMPIFRQIIVRLEELEAKNPSDIDLVRSSENAHIYLANDLSWEDQMTEADGEVKKAVAIGEPLLAANPNDAEIRRALWLTYFLAGGIFVEADFARSRSFFEKSIRLVQQTSAADEVDFQSKHDLAQSYSALSVVAVSEKKFDEAIALLEKSREILQQLSAAEPRHAGYRLNLANNLDRLGDAQAGKGNLPDALASYETAIELHEKMRETDADDNMPVRNIGTVNQKIGEIYQKMKQCEKAVEFDQKSLAMFDLLKQRNAFDEYDKKTVEDLEKSLARCRQENGTWQK